MSRRDARRHIFNLMFQNEFNKEINTHESIETYRNEYENFERKDILFIKNEYTGILENVEKISSQTECKAQLFDLNDHETLRKEINESAIFTNATNVGMGKLEGQMVLPDTSYLRKDLIVSDVIYMPEKTKLLEEAEKIGCKTINGLGMMLYQGAASFKLWTDQDMPIDKVKEALDF